MPLPTIDSVSPTSVPATAAIEFNQSFLTRLEFSARDPRAPWQCELRTQNYNAELGLLDDQDSARQAVSLDDVAHYAGEFPVFAQTMAMVLITAGKVMAERSANRALAAAHALPMDDAGRADAIATAQVALTAARIALGAAS